MRPNTTGEQHGREYARCLQIQYLIQSSLQSADEASIACRLVQDLMGHESEALHHDNAIGHEHAGRVRALLYQDFLNYSACVDLGSRQVIEKFQTDTTGTDPYSCALVAGFSAACRDWHLALDEYRATGQPTITESAASAAVTERG